MPYLQVEHGEIWYEDHGSGYPVLLFAPGFLSSRIERWSANPARPGVAQDWLDPIAALQPQFRVIALDVRNAGRSRATIGPDDDWSTYTRDHLALLDHLGISRVHVMGACIGVSFALALAEARPGLVSALVLQNPIGLWENREAIEAEFELWADQMRARPDIDARELPGFHQRLFGGEFIFSVTTAFVRGCEIPMLLMPGNDLMHPAANSAELARAPHVEIVAPWKGASYRDDAMRRVRDFFIAQEPAT
jgi:pimeloyl-ACP methyl ester carboxylesterase